MKPSLTLTFERKIDRGGPKPVTLAVTLSLWGLPDDLHEIDTEDLQKALAEASTAAEGPLFGEVSLPPAPSCKDCRFFAPDHHQCRRHTPGRNKSGIIDPDTRPRWPIVQAEDWCGEFSPRL